MKRAVLAMQRASLALAVVSLLIAACGLPPPRSPADLQSGVPYQMAISCPVYVDIAGTYWQFPNPVTPLWPQHDPSITEPVVVHGTFTKRTEQLAVFSAGGEEWLLHRIASEGMNPCV